MAMKPEIKFALLCCLACTFIAIFSTPINQGFLTASIVVNLSLPLIFLIEKILRFLELDYPLLGLLITMNVNVFIITYLLAKLYFLLKSLNRKNR